MQVFKLAILIFILFIFSGCTPPPKIIYKEVLIPIKCPINMPSKPENLNNFESKKALIIYFLQIENLLKGCAGE